MIMEFGSAPLGEAGVLADGPHAPYRALQSALWIRADRQRLSRVSLRRSVLMRSISRRWLLAAGLGLPAAAAVAGAAAYGLVEEGVLPGKYRVA